MFRVHQKFQFQWLVLRKSAGHLMENIESENLLHRGFGVCLFNLKYELLLQACISGSPMPCHKGNVLPSADKHLLQPPIVPGVQAYWARNAAQRKLLDEVGIPAEKVPVDDFIPLG
ncbi:hypothetical protein NL676_017527 [Syzygium grande]|nr:hypothetical protein NL676_017527 [Syzygium grande]